MISKTIKKLIKVADSIEKKYERLDKDPDELSWEDTDPAYFGEEDDFVETKQLDTPYTAEWLMQEIYPHFIKMNKEEQHELLNNLVKMMKATSHRRS